MLKMDNDKKLKRIQFFVEADSFAQQSLWEKFHKKIEWEQDLSGFGMTLGQIKKRPIFVSFSFAKIGGKYVCFYNATSQLVDHKMIEDYLEKNYPIKYDGGSRRAMTDANNFHNCYHFCQE